MVLKETKMKKSTILLLLFISNLLNAQQEKNDPLIFNVEGLYGISAIYDHEKTGGVGLGGGVWIPFKDGFIDLGVDFTSSASRNHGELQMLFNYTFSLISDSTVDLSGYYGAGIVIGRIFNKEKYFGPGIEDYNTGGVIGNIGMELKPNGSKNIFYLDAKTGVINVPGWDENVRTPFKISLGVRFVLDKVN